MKRGVLMAVLTAFVIICLASNLVYYNGIGKSIVAEVVSDLNTEKISLWLGKNNEVYVFLPSYADLMTTRLLINDRASVTIDGMTVEGETACGQFELDTAYEVIYESWGMKEKYTLKFVKSANIATIYIDTESGSMDYVHGKKGNEEAGTFRLYLSDGKQDVAKMFKSISGRGNTTWDEAEKKPYILDFGEDTDLLKMGEARDWILLANANDPSNIRNRIVYDFAQKGKLAFSPESQWVDVYLNTEYAGVYLLSEQNEVHEERIDIEGKNSFLVSLERRGRMVTQNILCIETDNQQMLRIRYPKEPTENELLVLNEIWQSVENAILAKDGVDWKTGKAWDELIDIDSWARKYLIEEIFGNLDACFVSQFFYYDGKSGEMHIKAGPVWDYDLSMARTWHTDNMNFMIANRLVVGEGFQTPWFYELYKKEAFYKQIKEIFQEEYLPLLYELSEQGIDEYDAVISNASEMNNIRWQTEDYAEEMALIREYISRRIAFLKQLWIEEREYHTIEARSEGVSNAYFAVADGENAMDLPILESSPTRTFMGWYDENGEPFDASQPIHEDKLIYARWVGISATITAYAQYFIPLAVIACMGVGVLIADIRRGRKGG